MGPPAGTNRPLPRFSLRTPQARREHRRGRMKNLTTIALGCLALGLAGAAHAQTTTTTQQTMPNGTTRTTTHVDPPDGSAATRPIDRPAGPRTVVRRRTAV